MEQRHLNTDLFAALTFHEMLLQQLTVAFLGGTPDNGEQFIKQFIDSLRYKLTVPPGSDTDAGVDVQQLQEVALYRAERFFGKVRKLVAG